MTWIILIVAFLASMLTLFSGFGLGTLLTPVFGVFFPLQVAVAMTGVVHLSNNLFKMSLLHRNVSREMLWRFGAPSVVGGLVGALLLNQLGKLPALYVWEWDGHIRQVTLLKLCIAALMIFFAFMEIVPALKKVNFAGRYLTTGGLLSGFFGGLSGHQGALRSAFLVNTGLTKEQFVATGTAIACLVDLTRLPIYIQGFAAQNLLDQWPLLLMTTAAAFAGAWLGTRYLKKITLETVQRITAVMIIIISVLLAAGVI
ncbi:MAG: sulfite exporter TauE/SafE family protein [Saprospiraceae bacterium]|nr:sulfite exporter TauE/SafE family protein [Saprospiraceae bacterium]